MNLDLLRQKIDSLDTQLIQLLNERAYTAISIGQAKKQTSDGSADDSDHHVFIPGREKKIFDKLASINPGPLSNDAVQSIYREIISASISLQKDVTIAFLGPNGTYSHQAALNSFGDSVNYVAFDTIPVEVGRVTYAVVPFENSTQGSISCTIDRLATTPCKIRAEAYQTVHHCLLSLSTDLSTIRRIYSHPEAFAQCNHFLNTTAHPRGIQVIPCASTSHAALLASQEPGSAAIAGKVCTNLYPLLRIVQENVQDEQLNVTRFFVIGKDSDSKCGADKTLLMLMVDHRRAALCDVLTVFKKHNINLTNIISRPQKLSNQQTHPQLWRYFFFLEFEGHAEDDAVVKVLSDLQNDCANIKWCGSFPDQLRKIQTVDGTQGTQGGGGESRLASNQ